MNKPSIRKLLWIFASLAVASLLTACFYAAAPQKKPAADAVAPKTLPAEFPMLMEAALMGNGAAEPTQEQKQEEVRIEKEQVEKAIARLGDTNSAQRVAGAEQLAAYPTPEAEKQLAKSLANDPAPEVRAEAAQSLDSFKKLEASTVRGLLTALEDPDENVRQTALGTLQSLYSRLVSDGKNKDSRKVLASLKKQSKSSRVPNEMRKKIADFLRDLR
jgi:hypothetical protein